MQKKSLGPGATTLFVFIVAMMLFLVVVLWDDASDIKFEKYVWRNLTPNTLEPPIDDDSPYKPLVLKISSDIEGQTGISLENIVHQGGEVIFNFFYTNASPIVSGYCDVVEVIIMTNDGKIVEDYILQYTKDRVKIDQRKDSI